MSMYSKATSNVYVLFELGDGHGTPTFKIYKTRSDARRAEKFSYGKSAIVEMGVWETADGKSYPPEWDE